MHGSACRKMSKAEGAREINSGRRQETQPSCRARAKWPLQKTHIDATRAKPASLARHAYHYSTPLECVKRSPYHRLCVAGVGRHPLRLRLPGLPEMDCGGR
jgi:hypothetical protein